MLACARYAYQRDGACALRWSLVRGVAAGGMLSLAGLVTAPILARALGPEGRGQLAAILQPLTIMDAVVAVGLPTAITILVADGASPRRISRVAVRVVSIVALVGFLGLCLYALRVSGEYGLSYAAIVCVFASVVPGAFLAVRRGMAAGLGRWKRLDADAVAGTVARVAAVLLGAYVLHLSAVGFAALFVGTGLLATAAVLSHPFLRLPERGRDIAGREVMGLALPGWVGAIALAGTARIDQAVMPLFGVRADVLGQYAVAVTVAEVPIILGLIGAREVLRRTAVDGHLGAVGRYSVKLCLLALAACAAAATLVPTLVPLVFGQDFAESVLPTQVLLGGTVLGIGNLLLMAMLNGLKRPGLASLCYLTGVATTLPLFFAFSENLTALTVSVISVIAQVVVQVAALVGLRRAVRSRVVEGV